MVSRNLALLEVKNTYLKNIIQLKQIEESSVDIPIVVSVFVSQSASHCLPIPSFPYSQAPNSSLEQVPYYL